MKIFLTKPERFLFLRLGNQTLKDPKSSLTQLTDFRYKNVLQIFSVGSENVKIRSSFLDVRRMCFKRYNVPQTFFQL